MNNTVAITGEITKTETIYITDVEMSLLVRDHILKQFDIPRRAFVDKGVLKCYVEHNTSHSFDETITIRPASKLDISALDIIDNLKFR